MKKIIYVFPVIILILAFKFLSAENTLITKTITNNALKRKGMSKRFKAKGKAFNRDCSGFVRAVFYESGIDLIKNPVKNKNLNMTARIYQSVLNGSGIMHKATPKPGDLIFFDRTYDADSNGIDTDDELTHIGIVLFVDKYKSVHYIHHVNKRLGVKIHVINIKHPHKAYIRFKGKNIRVNNYVKRGGLAPEHFRCFVTLN